MKNLDLLFLTVGIAMSLSAYTLATEVQAAPQCTSAKGQVAFDMGLSHGKRLVHGAFDAMGKDCGQLEKLRSLSERLAHGDTGDSAGSEDTQCRKSGTIRGVQMAVTEITTRCKAGRGSK